MGAYKRAFIVIFLGTPMATPLFGQASKTVATSKPAEQAFKNVQVLKGVPANQFIPAMQFMTASLGVSCDFCHVERAFEKDDKEPKRIARKMMQMMSSINEQNFAGERKVTCYSCHRGVAKPVSIPVLDQPKPETAAAKSTGAPVPSFVDVFGRYLQALGGDEAIQKLNTRVEIGTVSYGDRRFPTEIFDQSPAMRASFVHLANGDNVTLSTGSQGWQIVPGRVPQQMSDSELDARKQEADLQFVLHMKSFFDDLQVRGSQEVGGTASYLVIGSRKHLPDVEFYFAQRSGLLVRDVHYLESPLGLLPMQTDYGDYRDIEGIKVAFRKVVSSPGGSYSIQLDRVQHNVTIDTRKFAGPENPHEAATQK